MYTTGGTTYYFGMNSYLANGGTKHWYVSTQTTDGMFWINSRVRMADVTDGTSGTLFFGERHHWDPVWDAGDPTGSVSALGGWAWANYQAGQDYIGSARVPINYLLPPGSNVNSNSVTDPRVCAFGSGHPGGCNFAKVDGSVRFLTLTGNSQLAQLQQLSTRATGEVVTVD
jgi:prepilin-type processing-associated H-X9-DG protein